MLAGGPGASPHLDSVQLNEFTEFEDGHFGAVLRHTGPADDGTPATLGRSRPE
jgi:hypothetical protein